MRREVPHGEQVAPERAAVSPADADGQGPGGAGAEAPSPSARERILAAAGRLFAAHGFEATTTKAIAREAGVPAGLIFYYFPSKQALLESVAQEAPVRADLERALAAPGEADLPALLAKVGLSALEVFSAHRHVLRILVRESFLHPPLAQRLRALLDTGLGLLSALLQRAVEAGHIVPVNVQAVARTFLSSLLVMSLLDEGDPRQQVEELVRVLVGGLLPPPAPALG